MLSSAQIYCRRYDIIRVTNCGLQRSQFSFFASL
nr:MAG TPA: hypothetical protein [Caudoviricetes sp.]